MIRTLHIKDVEDTPVGWWPSVEALKGLAKIDFKPGLNILWGPNGSGKSTILKALARLTCSEQGGVTTVTHNAVRELERRSLRDGLRTGMELDHDGQAVRSFNPEHKVGILGGGFDDDFFDMGVFNTMTKGSSGQLVLMQLDNMFVEMLAGVVPESRVKVTSYPERDGSEDSNAKVMRLIQGAGDKGQPTALLDEPDRSLDLTNQFAVWRTMRALSGEVQFIVATHSPFALRIPDANYIDIVPGAREKATKAVEALEKWPDMLCAFSESVRAKAKKEIAKRDAHRKKTGLNL